ncbi:MAG: FAD-binding oxidoreductase [Rhodospirillales bacterium]|nr:MAG: FAD-binding oxidoreductase [Rhodospirillales bacterium]
MAETCDSIIIGAGIIGSATALALARKGWKPLAIDALPAAGYGSTSASCAIIRPYYSTVDGSAIAYESHFYWKDWPAFLGFADERGLARYVNCGCTILKTGRNGQLAAILSIMDELGVPYAELDAAALQDRLPGIDLNAYAPPKRPEDPAFGLPNGGTISGAAFFPTGGYISDPQLAAHNMQRAAEAAGAAFRFNSRVAEIATRDGRVAGVTLTDGTTIAAPVVVNVAGPHSSKVNRMAGVDKGMKIGTRALRHEVAHVPAPEGLDLERNRTVFSDSDIGGYCRSETGNFLLIGSEDPECDPREWVDPDEYDTEFSEHWRTQVMRAAQRFPKLGIPSDTRGVVSLYDVTDDWIPIYDKSDLPGFYMAVGTSGNQFKNAPIAGEMMAELIVACEGGQDHDREPVGFRLRHIGREVSIGFYSRQREVNPDSSFSVLG